MSKLLKISFLLILMIFSRNIFGQGRQNTSGIPPMRTDIEEELYLKSIKTPQYPMYLYKISEETRRQFVLAAENERLNNDRSRIIPLLGYYTKYGDFLKDKKTGIPRLHPETNCHRGKIVSVEEAERCSVTLPIIGNGFYYSFRMKSNLKSTFAFFDGHSFNAGEWNDIHYTKGKIEVGGETIQGMITELENIDFQKLNYKHLQIKSLKNYKAEKNYSEVEKQKEVINQGLNLDGLKYSDSVSIKLGSTYLLRSIAYIVLLTTPHPIFAGQIFNRMEIRNDSIIGFQVVGQ